MRTNASWSILAAVLISLTLTFGHAACGGVSEEELQQIIEESKACAPGDTCILAGGGQCRCSQPINAKHKARVEQAVADYDCDGLMVSCAGNTNVRCEAGRCVSDTP
jgi:hypothetical protein